MTECPHCGYDPDEDVEPEDEEQVKNVKIKGRDIEVSRYNSRDNWYIVVRAPNGCYEYDGTWPNSASKTADEAIQEAREGLCMDEEEES